MLYSHTDLLNQIELLCLPDKVRLLVDLRASIARDLRPTRDAQTMTTFAPSSIVADRQISVSIPHTKTLVNVRALEGKTEAELVEGLLGSSVYNDARRDLFGLNYKLEVPLSGVVENRRYSGRADLLLDGKVWEFKRSSNYSIDQLLVYMTLADTKEGYLYEMHTGRLYKVVINA